MLFIGYNSFLGYTTSGDSVITNIPDVNSVTQKNTIVDDLFLTKSTPDISSPIDKTWNFDTILYAMYQDNLLAGNIDFVINTCSEIRVKMRKKNTYSWMTLFEVPITSVEDLSFERFTSYCQGNKTEYEFALVPILNGVEGNYNINSAVSNFDDLFVIDSSGSFYANTVQISPVRHRDTSIITPLNSKYPIVISNTNNNYTDGTITGLFIQNINGDFDKVGMQQYRESFKNFLFNGLPKIIKYHNGDMWLVEITGEITDDTSNANCEDYTKSQFKFTEIGDATDAETLYDNGLIDIYPFSE